MNLISNLNFVSEIVCLFLWGFEIVIWLLKETNEGGRRKERTGYSKFSCYGFSAVSTCILSIFCETSVLWYSCLAILRQY